ncbi:MAG: hypothetical protein ACR2G6_13265 [Gemmatimonadaceae bacterium]
MDDAEDIYRRYAREFGILLSRIEAAHTEGRFDSAALLARSLISGVTTGEE